MNMTTIPLSQLKASKANMRKTNRRAGIKELAASIAVHGLLENLVVHRTPNGTDAPSYEVVAGGRRLEALNRLAKAGSIEVDQPIPCLIKQEGIDGVELSLAENFERMPPHPADQFEAFAKLARNATPEAIASRFGISVAFIRQRLKLARVSRRLLAQYRTGAMTLEQLTAFTISEDQALQEKVWFDYPNADIDPSYIRRQLTQSQVPASDRRSRFIGTKAYAAAGGVIIRDLFDSEHEGYFNDSQLLDRLVVEKLTKAAEALRAEGWSWVQVVPEADYHSLADFRRVQPSEIDLSPDDEATLANLAERYDVLVAEIEENGEGEEELDVVEAELDALRARKEAWTEADKARAGAIVSLQNDGTVLITRGLARDTELAEVAGIPDQAKKQCKAKAGYADSVLADLSAHRTAALRACVASKPDVAFLALLYALVSGLFHGRRSDCVEVAAIETALDRASQTVGESKASKVLFEHAVRWNAEVPEREALWPWLTGLDFESRQALMAYCVSLTISALANSQRDEVRNAESNILAEAIGLDMHQWWEPSSAFLGHLTKAQILSALSEVGLPDMAQRMADLKKSCLVERTAPILQERGWLPHGWCASL